MAEAVPPVTADLRQDERLEPQHPSWLRLHFVRNHVGHQHRSQRQADREDCDDAGRIRASEKEAPILGLRRCSSVRGTHARVDGSPAVTICG